MKTSNYFILLMMASAIVGACSKQETSDLQETKKQGVLSASISQPADEDATKTSLNGELDVVWSDDDAIAVFADGATTLVKYTSDNIGTGTTKATFTGDAGTYAYAYYPYKGANSVDGSNNISVVIPRVQTYAANTFGQFDMPMLATIAADKLNFTNLMAVLKLQLTGTGTVSRIIVMSETQKLSGKAVVATDGSITFDATEGMSYNWVELDCGAGVALSGEATPFLIAVPAGDYAFTVRVVSTESKVAPDKSVASAKTFTANKIKKMASYAVAFGGDVKYVDGAFVGEPVVIHSVIDDMDYTWAPVNVGYDASYTNGKYGKVFQAGRKYGQRVGITIIPTTEERTAEDGSDIFNEFKFYSASFMGDASWLGSAVPQYYKTGAKTEYDPCPVGWRAPSLDELKKLMGYKNASSSYHNGRNGYSERHDKVDGVWGFYYDGGKTANDPVSGVYLPAAGMRARASGSSVNLGQNGAIMMGCNNITSPSWYMIQSETYDTGGLIYNERITPFTGQTVGQAFAIRCIKE